MSPRKRKALPLALVHGEQAPAEPDKQGLDIASWPESAWTNPRRKWLLIVRRKANGMWERKKFKGERLTYAEAIERRAEYLRSGRYEQNCILSWDE